MLTWRDLFSILRRADQIDKGSVVIVKFKNKDDKIYSVMDIKNSDNKMILILGNEYINYFHMLIKAKDAEIWGKSNYNPALFVKFENELLSVKEIYFDETFDIILTI